MQHRLVASEDGRLSPAVLVAVALAWAGVSFASVSGVGLWLGHGHLLKSGLPVPIVLGSFAGGWLLMLVAMMLPMLPRQSEATASFVAGFLWMWMAFGLLALLFDAGVHWTVDHSSWLRLHSWLIQSLLLATAGVYQLTSVKRGFLGRCLGPADGGTLADGWWAGALSVGCCWALMLTAFAAGMTQLGWMVGLTVAMMAERHQQRWRFAAALVGVVLLAFAVGLTVTSITGSENLLPS